MNSTDGRTTSDGATKAAHFVRATLEDIPTIRKLAHDTWPAAYGAILSPGQLGYMLERIYSDDALREQMEVKRHLFLLAIEDCQAVGFAGFEHHYKGGKNTRLHKLYVLPGRQSRGLGAELIRQVSQAVRDAGDTAIELNVNKYNKAKDFYARLGFRIMREEVIDIGHGYVMDDFVMEKKF